MSGSDLTVGQAAAAAGVSAKAVRLYEARGLLDPAERTASGYRMFGPGHVDTLRFIRQARSLGLHLDDIKDVLELSRDTAAPPCGRVVRLLEDQLSQIDRRIAELQALRDTLTRVHDTAPPHPQTATAVVCPVIESCAPAVGN